MAVIVFQQRAMLWIMAESFLREEFEELAGVQ